MHGTTIWYQLLLKNIIEKLLKTGIQSMFHLLSVIIPKEIVYRYFYRLWKAYNERKLFKKLNKNHSLISSEYRLFS